MTLPSRESLIRKAITDVTKRWTKQKKAEARAASARANRVRAMTRSHQMSTKEATWMVMERAYLKASTGGKLPAKARQVMYAARPYIQELTGEPLNDQYFTQTLLPDYVKENGVEWNIDFDARGKFTEPHTDLKVPLGTAEVRSYINGLDGFAVPDLEFDIWEELYPTKGPRHRYSAVLYCEKEGFDPLFKAVDLAARYDLAIMSNKGMSVVASRELVSLLSSTHSIPVYVLHDFDISGFSILGTLARSTRRFEYKTPPKVIDIGFRLDDIDGLQAEDVGLEPKSIEKKRLTLARHGATKEEIDVLAPRRGYGTPQRVELNAMTSDQLVAFIERKLDENGVSKVIPDDEALAGAYRRMRRQAIMQAKIDKFVEGLDLDEDGIAVPDDLRDQVKDALDRSPVVSWDKALREIAEDDDGPVL